MKLIIFVHTCKLYEESRAKKIEATWGDLDNVVFITDNPLSTLKRYEYIGEYKSGPTYHPENVVKMFFLFMNKYTNYDFFMMIDDDSYLYVDKLYNYLSYFEPTEKYMIGDYMNWVSIYTGIDSRFVCDYTKWVTGGPGIVFTKSCIVEFLNLIHTYNMPYVNHDVWLHKLYMLSNHSIKRVDCPGFHQFNASVLCKKYSRADNRIISVHLERNLDLLEIFHQLK
jgi:hypothetical protein